MITYKSSLKKIKKNKIKIDNEIILSKDSVNRISTININSPNNYPSADNSAYDGFALSSKDTKNITYKKNKKFKILKTLAAGDNPYIKKTNKYSTVEVMTGAIIRKPFDTIIPVEKIKFYPNKVNPKYVVINKKLKKNEYIRFKGSDYRKGDRVVNKGELITASHILAFKTLGIKKVLVKKKPKILFYTTGNEISNNDNIPVWKVRNSNSYYLKSYLKNFPITFKEKKILRDKDISKFEKEILKNLNSKVDIVITSGAISAGKFDFVPNIIKKFKLIDQFKGVAIRPGKPIMFAKFKKNMVFFGLPGNPLSSAACFKFFVLPFLYSSLGLAQEKPIPAKIKNNFIKRKNFTRFIKGKLFFSKKGIAEFKIFSGQESYRISPFTKSNAWGFFSAEKANFKKGDLINCYFL